MSERRERKRAGSDGPPGEPVAILERIAMGAGLGGTLDEIVRRVEEQIPGAIGSCLLLDRDGKHLRGASVKGLPPAYNAAIEGVAIGEGVGSCGTAAARGQGVFVADIETDALWKDYRELAGAHGLRACWSVPILSRRGADRSRVLGTFAVYFREVRAPEPGFEQAFAEAERLASIAIGAERAATELREEEARFRAFVDHASEALFMHDAADGTVVDVNRQACESLGRTREELVGTHPTEFDADLSPEILTSIVGRLGADETVTFDTRHRRKDGTFFPVEVRIRAFMSAGRKLNLASVRDTTERRAIEEKLRQVQKMDAVATLAGGIAHDFNNLLTVIGSTVSILLEEVPSESPWREDLLSVQKASERATTLTAQLLAFGRRAIIEPRAVDLNALVDRLAKVFERVIGERIVLETSLAPGLPSIHADPSQVEQVLLNLVINARDAMPSGGRLTLETATAPSPDGLPTGASVRLSVIDTGTGMSDEVRSKAFDPFFTTKGPGQGTGLGLATVYGVMRQAGGSITIDSTLGHGTRFDAFFPRSEHASMVPPPPRPGAARGSETVLVVEDQDPVRQVIARVLTASGYRVLLAEDGERALDIERRHDGRIDLVLTDVVMPGMGGRAVADAIRARRPNVGVLFMSGYTDDEVVRDGVLAAVDAFLAKPFTPGALVQKVRDVLDGPISSRPLR